MGVTLSRLVSFRQVWTNLTRASSRWWKPEKCLATIIFTSLSYYQSWVLFTATREIQKTVCFLQRRLQRSPISTMAGKITLVSAHIFYWYLTQTHIFRSLYSLRRSTRKDWKLRLSDSHVRTCPANLERLVTKTSCSEHKNRPGKGWFPLSRYFSVHARKICGCK